VKEKNETAMKHIPWKLGLLFSVVVTILLFCYRLFFLLIQASSPENRVRFLGSIAPTTFLFYLAQTLPFVVLLCVPVFFYLHNRALRIRKLINAAHDWGKGDFSVIIQDNKKDDIGYLSQKLDEMARELQNYINAKQETASVKERNILARELHDTVKQQIFALAFQVSIARKIHHSQDDQLSMHLLEAKKILSDIQEELTNLIVPMRQGALENQDLADALATYLSRWSHQYGIFVKFTTEIQGQEKNYPLSAHVKGTFFRVAQEALSNVGRHSKASSVSVTLTIGWMYVILKIADNGQGFSYTKQKESGVGLSSMRERMRIIDGDLHIDSKLLSGTEVLATYHPKDTGPNVAIFNTYRKEL
jgi:signal transduction histidine kinase